jgi:menaquinol-cytochrome c reductase iron-sulfur subunit
MPDLHVQESNPAEITRRRFLSWAIGVIGTFIGAALTIPILGYAISPALRRQGQNWADAGPESSLRNGEPVRVEYLIEHKDGWIDTAERKSAWVIRSADGSLLTFDPRCTHLGCPYSWDTTTKRFFCPCHNGVFAADGSVVSGPPPRPLDRFQARVQNGRVMILEEAAHAG